MSNGWWPAQGRRVPVVYPFEPRYEPPVPDLHPGDIVGWSDFALSWGNPTVEARKQRGIVLAVGEETLAHNGLSYPAVIVRWSTGNTSPGLNPVHLQVREP